MVEVKVNWQWCSLVDDEDVARSFYAKLGYSAEEIELKSSSPKSESTVQPVAD